jgi:myb proto-oncogene protein
MSFFVAVYIVCIFIFNKKRGFVTTFGCLEGGREAWDEGNQARCLIGEQYVAKSSISNSSDADELCPDSPLPVNDAKLLIKPCGFDESCENDAHLSSQLPKKRSSFPPSAQALIDAVKKNRALQKFLRSKLIEIEAKIEQNKKLRDKVKLLKDFQVSCSKRTASALSMKKDPRVQLISSKKPVATKKSRVCIMLLWFCDSSTNCYSY